MHSEFKFKTRYGSTVQLELIESTGLGPGQGLAGMPVTDYDLPSVNQPVTRTSSCRGRPSAVTSHGAVIGGDETRHTGRLLARCRRAVAPSDSPAESPARGRLGLGDRDSRDGHGVAALH